MLLNQLATIEKIHDATSFPLHDFAKTHHGTILNKVVLHVLPRYSLIVDAKSFMTKKCHISKQSYFFGNPFGFHLNLTFGNSNQILTHFFSTIVFREVVKKSKWKFKMAFAIRGPPPPPLNGKISRHFFTPLFFFCN